MSNRSNRDRSRSPRSRAYQDPHRRGRDYERDSSAGHRMNDRDSYSGRNNTGRSDGFQQSSHRSYNGNQGQRFEDFSDHRREERVDRRWSGRDERYGGMNDPGVRFGVGGRHSDGPFEGQRFRNSTFRGAGQVDRVCRNPFYNGRNRCASIPLPATGFELDTSSDKSILQSPTNVAQNCYYPTTFYRDNLLGATEEYLTKNKIQSYKKPAELEPDKVEPAACDAVDLTQIGVESSPNKPSMSKPKAPRKSEDYISFRKNSKLSPGESPAESQFPKRKSERFKTIKEGVEYYNSSVREQPRNIDLWREFVQFQEQVFEYDDTTGGRRGKKTYRKQMMEKKIAILEKAISQNPKCTDLQFDRLDLLKEVAKPVEVTREWKQLLAYNSDVPCIWLERLAHSVTDLQNFSSSGIIKEFTPIFEKFRIMLNPSYPELQKPKKLFTLIADALSCLCSILKASGFTEKAVSLQQAQLELDFNLPKELLKSTKGKNEHSKVSQLFKLFWDLGTLHFGEPGAVGWSKVLELDGGNLSGQADIITVADGKVASLEETVFGYLNEMEDVRTQKCSNWLLIESLRSKVYWSPWRKNLSDLDECDDSQRVVLSSELTPFLISFPEESIGSIDEGAFYFRHVINYLLLLEDGFIPRTHTLDSALSPFSTIKLTESRVLFSEIYYWKQFMKLYLDDEKGESWIPEGFRVPEYTLTSTSSVANTGTEINILPSLNDSLAAEQDAILKENEQKYNNLIRTVVEQSIEKLEPKFAEILVQMYFRYVQKETESYPNLLKRRLKECKNLLKHEKLRSSISTYSELALIEYFGGSQKKAISILVKTINSTSQILKTQEGSDMSELDLDSNWELVSEITKLYRILAEFFIKDKPEVALNILVALGNKFSSVDIEGNESMYQKPSNTQILKAKSFFESVLDTINQNRGNPVDEEDGEEKGYPDFLSKWGSEFCLEFYLQRTNIVIEWTTAFALFHFLSTSYDSACDVLEKVISWVVVPELSKHGRHDPIIVNAHHIKEQLYITWIKLGAMVVSKNSAEHSKFRSLLGTALDLYPSSPPLLLLYTTVEGQCSIAGKLWRNMVKKVKQETGNNICTLHWAPLFMSLTLARQIEEIERDTKEALDDFGLGGPAVAPDTIFYKLDAILSAAGNHPLTRHCPLIWRVQLRHLALRCKVGKDIKRAKGVFYEAIRNSPSSKSLYMDAIAYLPDLMSEVMDLMAEKQVLVRLPTEELDLLLAIEDELEEEIQSKESKKSKRTTQDADVVDISD